MSIDNYKKNKKFILVLSYFSKLQYYIIVNLYYSVIKVNLNYL